MANKELSPTTTALFCVEGKDDRYVLEHFCHHLGVVNFEIWEVDTKSSKSYKKELQLLKNEPHFANIRHLAIICDADKNEEEARVMLREALENTGFPVPSLHEECAANEVIQTGVFVMSGASGNGAIEELFFETLESNPIMECVNGYFSCLEKKSVSSPKQLSKAKVQVYLAGAAGKKDIVQGLGHAARAGHWHFDHPKLDRLRNFLNNFK